MQHAWQTQHLQFHTQPEHRAQPNCAFAQPGLPNTALLHVMLDLDSDIPTLAILA